MPLRHAERPVPRLVAKAHVAARDCPWSVGNAIGEVAAMHSSTRSDTAVDTAWSPGAAHRGPRLTVVVCAYTMDRWGDLVTAIESLNRQERPADEVLLIVDHCPPLAARAGVELPAVRVVPSRGRPGLSGARNTGIAEATGDVVAFLDDDAAADPDWTARLLDAYGDERVLGVGGLIRPRWDGRRPSWFPTEFDWVVGCTHRGMPLDRAPVRNFIGANMSLRRDVLTTVGGFRADLGRIGTHPLGCEETELCIRAARAYPDGVLLYEPAAAVDHHVPDKRATWSYFRARCFAEGLSKAAVARLAGSRRALATERSYLRTTIPRALIRPLRPGPGRPSLATVAVIIGGIVVTVTGYAVGRLRVRRGASATSDEASTADNSSPDTAPDRTVPRDLRADVSESPRWLGRRPA
jgi:glucosyl-dolichyl phosphate glucuronosyltransferase